MIIIVQPPPFVKGIFLKSYEEIVNSRLSFENCLNMESLQYSGFYMFLVYVEIWNESIKGKT